MAKDKMTPEKAGELLQKYEAHLNALGYAIKKEESGKAGPYARMAPTVAPEIINGLKNIQNNADFSFQEKYFGESQFADHEGRLNYFMGFLPKLAEAYLKGDNLKGVNNFINEAKGRTAPEEVRAKTFEKLTKDVATIKANDKETSMKVAKELLEHYGDSLRVAQKQVEEISAMRESGYVHDVEYIPNILNALKAVANGQTTFTPKIQNPMSPKFPIAEQDAFKELTPNKVEKLLKVIERAYESEEHAVKVITALYKKHTDPKNPNASEAFATEIVNILKDCLRDSEITQVQKKLDSIQATAKTTFEAYQQQKGEMGFIRDLVDNILTYFGFGVLNDFIEKASKELKLEDKPVLGRYTKAVTTEIPTGLGK